MGTYSDCVTLLFCFFVLLYAASSPDEQKMQYLLQAFASKGAYVNPVVADLSTTSSDRKEGNSDTAPETKDGSGTGSTPETFDQLFNWLAAAAASSEQSDSIDVSQGGGRIHIRFDDDIMFEPNSMVLTQAGRDALNRFRPGINAVKNYILKIDISGHTSQGFSNISDWQLSCGRAASVADFMTMRGFVEPEKYLPEGYGPYQPLYAADDPKNRRVELVIVRNNISDEDTPIVKDILEYDYNVKNRDIDGVTGVPVVPDNSNNKYQNILDAIAAHYSIPENGSGTPGTPVVGPPLPGDMNINPDDLYPVDEEGNVIKPPDAAAASVSSGSPSESAESSEQGTLSGE